MNYKVLSYGMSDIGLVRDNNEDVWLELPDINTYVLADGMGGHRAGEVAATQAVDSFSKEMKKILDKKTSFSLGEIRSEIEHVMQLVNTHVYNMGCRDPELKGMGTTLCCLYFHKDGLIRAHIGDSRIYRLRNGEFKQITKDHSLMRELVDLGQLDEKGEKEFVYKNIITKAVGTEPYVEASVYVSDLEFGDTYLICSDGLSDVVSAPSMKEVIEGEGDLKNKGDGLIRLAKEKGGHDNITIVLLKVEEVLHGREDLSR
ncbi:MAG: Stp1/IreP family PP2C-type Ser/Thr phosphatase [Chlamydiota bacterium]|nr:Stp1/IreP family PP2C-type Ser/Thr phosphatase [Chlamydiota bacterium]